MGGEGEPAPLRTLVAMLAAAFARLDGLRVRRTLSDRSRSVLDRRLTYLPPQRLRSLERLVRTIDEERIDGAVVECGVALGGSAIVLAALSGRQFDGYDVFGEMPAPGPNDPPSVHARFAEVREGRSAGLGGDVYYGYRDDLLAFVSAEFAHAGVPVDGERVRLHVGLFDDTLHPDGPVALAHIDCDRYDPVALCLPRLWSALTPGGFIAIDDYTGRGGCRAAVDEFLAAHPDASLVTTRPHGILRKAR